MTEWDGAIFVSYLRNEAAFMQGGTSANSCFYLSSPIASLPQELSVVLNNKCHLPSSCLSFYRELHGFVVNTSVVNTTLRQSWQVNTLLLFEEFLQNGIWEVFGRRYVYRWKNPVFCLSSPDTKYKGAESSSPIHLISCWFSLVCGVPYIT